MCLALIVVIFPCLRQSCLANFFALFWRCDCRRHTAMEVHTSDVETSQRSPHPSQVHEARHIYMPGSCAVPSQTKLRMRSLRFSKRWRFWWSFAQSRRVDWLVEADVSEKRWWAGAQRDHMWSVRVSAHHFSPEDGDGMLLQNTGFCQLVHTAF
jgi:hypothetical protein